MRNTLAALNYRISYCWCVRTGHPTTCCAHDKCIACSTARSEATRPSYFRKSSSQTVMIASNTTQGWTMYFLRCQGNCHGSTQRTNDLPPNGSHQLEFHDKSMMVTLLGLPFVPTRYICLINKEKQAKTNDRIRNHELYHW